MAEDQDADSASVAPSKVEGTRELHPEEIPFPLHQQMLPPNQNYPVCGLLDLLWAVCQQSVEEAVLGFGRDQ